MPSLFPNVRTRSDEAEDQFKALSAAPTISPSRTMLGAGLAFRDVARQLGGVEDQATKVNRIKAEMQQSGLKFGQAEYYDALADKFAENGMLDAAIQVSASKPKAQEQWITVADNTGNVVGQQNTITGEMKTLTLGNTKEGYEPVYNAQGKLVAQKEVGSGKIVADPRVTDGSTAKGVNVVTPEGAKGISFNGGRTMMTSDGEITVPPGSQIVSTSATGTPEELGLTPSDASKLLKEFDTEKVNFNRVQSLKNRILDQVKNNSTQLGVVGAIAELGEEARSSIYNAIDATGVDLKTLTKKSIDDYVLPKSLAAASATTKTNLFSLALLYASMIGLGEGRSLTDTDVERAIDALGAGSNSFEILNAKLNAIEQIGYDGLAARAKVNPKLSLSGVSMGSGAGLKVGESRQVGGVTITKISD
jgi:hypothetical protein